MSAARVGPPGQYAPPSKRWYITFERQDGTPHPVVVLTGRMTENAGVLLARRWAGELGVESVSLKNCARLKAGKNGA